MSRVRCEVARVQKKNGFGDGTRRRDAFARARKRGANGATSVARCRSGEDFASSVFFPRIFSFGSSSFWSRAIIIIIIIILHEQQRSVVKSTLTDVFGLLLIREKQQQRHRVYVRGVILGYKRARTNQHENTSLIKLENVPDKSSTAFYLGKKLCYVYKAHTKKQGTVYRTMWGKVTRAHGTSGVVRAKFKHNLPPSSIGGKIRCMLYPSNI